MRLVFFLSLFIYSKDIAQCVEASSLHGLIDVLIFNREVVVKIKNSGRWFEPPARVRVDDCLSALQIEFLSAADRRTAVVHPQLVVNVIGVGV